MSFSRYKIDPKINDGSQLSSAAATRVVRAAIKNGELGIERQVVVTGADRLDTLAGSIYGDSRYWWVLAASSNIGWGLQIPPGTVVNVVDIREVERLLS